MADVKYTDTFLLRLPAGTIERIKKAKRPHEKLSEFIRNAVCDELEIREHDDESGGD